MLGKTEFKNNRPRDGRHCDLCGCSFPAVRCDKCSSQIFCLSCDDMYHRHPKRRFHLRKAVDPTPTPQARPVLPMKLSNLALAPGDPAKMPLPPPRKKKPGKSIFDSFRRASPSEGNPNLPKKEYSWSDRIGGLTKFMSNRPLPPVPDETEINNHNNHQDNSSDSNHTMAFIHKRVEEKPPALPQRQPRNHSESPVDGETNGDSPAFPAVNGNASQNFIHDGRNNQAWQMHSQFPQQGDIQGFGTIRRQSQPQERRVESPSGMHQSSSATDLTSLPGMTGPMQPFPPYGYNPHLPPAYPYPMYPQYPPYQQYFGNSWGNLASPPQTTDADVSDLSESSSKRSNRGRFKNHIEKKAKRSQSLLVDRVAFPGPYYPFGPFPAGYPGNPWMQTHPEAPPSPAVSLRSLSRLGQTQRRARNSEDDGDYSSSPVSRPKSSSSEVSKNRTRAKTKSCPSSSSDEESRTTVKPKASPSSERRYLKTQNLKKRPSSPRRPSKEFMKTHEQNFDSSEASASRGNIQSSSRYGGDTSDREQNDPAERLKSLKLTETMQSTSPGVIVQESKDTKWQCNHCTFINSPNDRICQVCYKTAHVSESPIAQEDVEIHGNTSVSPMPRKEQVISPLRPESDQRLSRNSDRDKQDIANLNSALDEAEKQINQSLVELLKVKEESSLPKSEDTTQPVSTSASSNAQESSGPHQTKSKTFPAYKSSSENKAKNKSEVKNNIYYIGLDTEVSVPVEQPETRKDSFCQTYQDLPQQFIPQPPQSPHQPGIMSGGTLPPLMGQRLFERQELMSPNLPYNPYQPQMQEQRYAGGYGGMHRGHSMASLLPVRTNEMLSPNLDYGGMSMMGFGASSMIRSLSRASLLGEADGWMPEYAVRPKPDFYLSMEELVERRRQETMRAQGLELVRMIREAEQQGFTADDIQVALNNCGKQNPVNWLQENWRNVIRTVVTLATNYGKDKKENDVGALSENEARDALRLHKGNIWASVTECVESRQRKFLELSARGNFNSKEIVDALTASEGDVEIAYAKLTNTTLKPFLMRIWGSGEGVPNLEGASPELLLPETESFNPDNKKDFASDEEPWDEDEYENEIGWDVDSNEGEHEPSPGLSSPDVTSFKSDDMEKSEKYHTLTRNDTCDNLASAGSDRSDYSDAFGPSGLGDRYLSTSSIDEIYLIDADANEEDFEAKRTKKKGTGFLSKLAALRKETKPTKNDISDPSSSPERQVESQLTNQMKDAPKSFNPIGILKQTFAAIKDTVTGGEPKSEKNGKNSIYEKRTIVVSGKVEREASPQPIDTRNNQSDNDKPSLYTVNEIKTSAMNSQVEVSKNKSISKLGSNISQKKKQIETSDISVGNSVVKLDNSIPKAEDVNKSVEVRSSSNENVSNHQSSISTLNKKTDLNIENFNNFTSPNESKVKSKLSNNQEKLLSKSIEDKSQSSIKYQNFQSADSELKSIDKTPAEEPTELRQLLRDSKSLAMRINDKNELKAENLRSLKSKSQITSENVTHDTSYATDVDPSLIVSKLPSNDKSQPPLNELHFDAIEINSINKNPEKIASTVTTATSTETKIKSSKTESPKHDKNFQIQMANVKSLDLKEQLSIEATAAIIEHGSQRTGDKSKFPEESKFMMSKDIVQTSSEKQRPKVEIEGTNLVQKSNIKKPTKSSDTSLNNVEFQQIDSEPQILDLSTKPKQKHLAASQISNTYSTTSSVSDEKISSTESKCISTKSESVVVAPQCNINLDSINAECKDNENLGVVLGKNQIMNKNSLSHDSVHDHIDESSGKSVENSVLTEIKAKVYDEKLQSIEENATSSAAEISEPSTSKSNTTDGEVLTNVDTFKQGKKSQKAETFSKNKLKHSNGTTSVQTTNGTEHETAPITVSHIDSAKEIEKSNEQNLNSVSTRGLTEQNIDNTSSVASKTTVNENVDNNIDNVISNESTMKDILVSMPSQELTEENRNKPYKVDKNNVNNRMTEESNMIVDETIATPETEMAQPEMARTKNNSGELRTAITNHVDVLESKNDEGISSNASTMNKINQNLLWIPFGSTAGNSSIDTKKLSNMGECSFPSVESSYAPIEISSEPVEISSAPVENSSTPVESSSAPEESSNKAVASSSASVESSSATVESSSAPEEILNKAVDSSPACVESSSASVESSPATVEISPASGENSLDDVKNSIKSTDTLIQAVENSTETIKSFTKEVKSSNETVDSSYKADNGSLKAIEIPPDISGNLNKTIDSSTNLVTSTNVSAECSTKVAENSPVITENATTLLVSESSTASSQNSIKGEDSSSAVTVIPSENFSITKSVAEPTKSKKVKTTKKSKTEISSKQTTLQDTIPGKVNVQNETNKDAIILSSNTSEVAPSTSDSQLPETKNLNEGSIKDELAEKVENVKESLKAVADDVIKLEQHQASIIPTTSEVITTAQSSLKEGVKTAAEAIENVEQKSNVPDSSFTSNATNHQIQNSGDAMTISVEKTVSNDNKVVDSAEEGNSSTSLIDQQDDSSYSSNIPSSVKYIQKNLTNISDGEHSKPNTSKTLLSAQSSTSLEENESEMEDDDIGVDILHTSMSSVRAMGPLRRMSFNTRKEAILVERHKDLTLFPLGEQKPWFTPKKVEPFKPALPKRTIKQQLEFERKVRKLVSDKKVRTYRKAEIVAQLEELKFEEIEAIYAANECSNLEMAISFLQQECQLCTGKYPIGEMISMVHCSHKACKECIKAYFTIQIRDRTIMELLCPFCNEPDITDEDIAQDYFNHLDIMLKKLVDNEIHELFQRKLRDRVLMKDPNFRWCSQCSSGFITDPYLKKLICPDCKAITCASCRRVWEREHESVSCEVFMSWKDANDPESQTTGLAKLLTEDGIDCPSCHFRYALAKGGCMHFRCIQCQHDFCSGCSKPFKMGKKCGVSEFCSKLGLHAHHPRNCLFYLRDKEPEDLQRLLDISDITYDRDVNRFSDEQRVCDVLEQKETVQGLVDDVCGKEVEYGFAGLCRVHYVEYLGQLVNKHKVDPIQIFGNDDLELVLKRASIRLPPKKYGESADDYRNKLVEIIGEKLPLSEVEGS